MGDQILISTHLVPGSVWKTRETFPDGTSRFKFLVVLRIEAPLVYYLRTTSKPAYFQKADGISFVLIPTGTCPLFKVDTYISCDAFHSKTVGDFRTLLLKGRIAYIGKIDTTITEKIKAGLQRSRVLSPKQRSRILGR